MKLIKATILLMLFGTTINELKAQTNVSGNIPTNTTWNTEGSPYVITGSTTVTTGDTLTIENGVEVRFDNGTQLTVSGGLIANGVTFTANSGNSRSTWNRIYLNSIFSNVHLKNSTIQFATTALDVTFGTARLDTVTISDSKYGVDVDQEGSVTINGSTITGNEYPIYYSAEGGVKYEETNDFTGNDTDVVYLAIPTNIDVNLRLENSGIPYLFSGSKYISAGDTLTIAKGNTLKFLQNNELYTQNGGVIIANGTESEPIYFTSNRNDNIGGDTNGDGTATAPGNRDWYGVRVIGDSQSSFKNVNVSFAGYQPPYYSPSDYRGGITLIDNDSKIDSSTFNNNYYGIVLRDSSDATVTNNTIGSSGVVPVALTFDSAPAFTNNSFSSSNNQYDAIGLIGTTITGTNYLPKRDFTSIPNVTYLLLSDLYVDTGSTLEIEPGVVIKSTGSGLHVKGTLTGDGTDVENIVFTSVKDDNVGNPNDTNKDGNNTVPVNTDWRGIAFGEDAGASILDYNQIRYATYNTSFRYNAANNLSINPSGAVNVMNGDVTITNSSIGNTQYYAIDSKGTAKPTISNNSFSNTGSVPIALDLSSDPTFSGNMLANVGLTAIGYHGGTLSNDGIIRARTFAGYDNITSVLLESATIASGTTLNIEPSTVVKVSTTSNIVLRVEGALVSAGTADSTIYFTSILDDQVGNPLDTNGDGGGTTPALNNWGTIRFMGTSDDEVSELSHTEIRYSKHGAIFTDAAPIVDNVTILSCQYYGFGIESGSTVNITNSTIQNCGWEPVAISTNSLPTFSGITFNSNGSNGVNLLESNFLSYYLSNVNYQNLFFDTRETVNSDETITPYSFAGYTNLPFIFRYQWTIGNNATVSVEPSVVFKGNHRLYIDGALRILGTESEPVIFTSYNDDSAGGDSNNDGNSSVPSPGQSATLNFRASSIDSLTLIKNTEFRYSSSALQFDNHGGMIDSSLIQLSQGDAILINGSSDPVITNNRFENIGNSVIYRGHSIYMDMFSSPTFSGNTESNVFLKGIGIKGGTWGSDATIPFRSFAGLDSVTYVLSGNITIPSGSKIIIPDGMTFKKWTRFGYFSRNANVGFTVDGALKIKGTSTNPVVFTNDTDDSYGKPADIYSNGNENDSYKTGTWITYNSTSDDTANTINNAIFRFADNGIIANSANPTINNSRFNSLDYGISLTGVSAPFVENNSFEDLNRTPLLISLVSYPQTVSGNTMSGSTFKAIGVRGETLVQDVTLPKRTFGGKVGIPYYFTGAYTIGTGAVLTISPGVINKFQDGVGINVQKGLIAEGGSTPDSIIIFTSIRDDFYGGDTNADSNATVPNLSYGNWPGIRYQGTSLSAQSILDYTVVKHVYNGTSYAGILADNSSPTVTNSILTENGRAVQVYGSGNPIINNNDIYNNREYGVFNRDKTFTIDATNNWWGNNSGPTHSTNPTGMGDEVSDGVDFGAFVGSGASNPILGDVSLNGKVQSFDASKILRVAALLDTLNATQQNVADVSGNGTVSAMDASFILQYVVGLIEAFPAELNSKSRTDMNSIEGTEDMILNLGQAVSVSETEFTVPIYIDQVSKLYSSQIELKFDENNLELLETMYSSIISDAMISENQSSRGIYTLAFATSKAISESGEVATLTFRIKDENSSPSISIKHFQANEIDLTTTSVSNDDVAINIPDEFNLYQNYPNPFNPSTTIGFDVPNARTQVRLEIYNILGQRVKTLINDVYSAGRYKVTWDGTNNVGGQVSTGVYIYRIQAGNIVQSKKLTFIK